MKKLYIILKIGLWCCVGAFIGVGVYQYCDYMTNPDVYVYQSAPWYTSIQIMGGFTAVVVAVILIAMWRIKKRIK